MSHLDNPPKSRVKSPASFMHEIQNKRGTSLFSRLHADSVEARIFRSMAFTTAIAGVGSAVFYPWRVTAGLLLGGVLALLNHYWLANSSKIALSVAAYGARPRISLVQYVLRYGIVAMVVFAAYQLNVVSLPATIAGLCTFVVALFVEALREIYLVIIHREEIS